jgi:hypothetical protein
VNVGERTNVTGSAKFRRLIEANDYAAALDVARQQVASGAQMSFHVLFKTTAFPLFQQRLMGCRALKQLFIAMRSPTTAEMQRSVIL